MGVLLNIITVHENVLSPRVTVQIAVKGYLPLLREATHELLNRKVDWMEDLVGRFPAPIEVLAR